MKTIALALVAAILATSASAQTNTVMFDGRPISMVTTAQQVAQYAPQQMPPQGYQQQPNYQTQPQYGQQMPQQQYVPQQLPPQGYNTQGYVPQQGHPQQVRPQQGHQQAMMPVRPQPQGPTYEGVAGCLQQICLTHNGQSACLTEGKHFQRPQNVDPMSMATIVVDLRQGLKRHPVWSQASARIDQCMGTMRVQ